MDEQRQRLLSAAAIALAERGYSELSVAHIIGAAGVSRTTFYEQFDNKRECVLVAHEQAFRRLADELVRGCAAEPEWPAKVVGAVSTAIVFAVRTPAEARLLLPEVLAADSVLVARGLAANDFLVGLMRTGRQQCPWAAALPDLTERALISGATSVIGRRLLCGQVDLLPALAPELVELILIPYMGNEEASRVARIAGPPPVATAD